MGTIIVFICDLSLFNALFSPTSIIVYIKKYSKRPTYYFHKGFLTIPSCNISTFGAPISHSSYIKFNVIFLFQIPVGSPQVHISLESFILFYGNSRSSTLSKTPKMLSISTINTYIYYI